MSAGRRNYPDMENTSLIFHVASWFRNRNSSVTWKKSRTAGARSAMDVVAGAPALPEMTMSSDGGGSSHADSQRDAAKQVQSVRFVLRGAWVKKFRRQGKQLAPHSVYMRMIPGALEPTIEWGARSEAVVSVDGGLFGDDFLGDKWFDKRPADECLCFSIGLAQRTVFILALSEAEKDRWVRGIDALVADWACGAVAEERRQQWGSPSRSATTRRSSLLLRALGLGTSSALPPPRQSIGQVSSSHASSPRQSTRTSVAERQPSTPVVLQQPPATRWRSVTEPQLPEHRASAALTSGRLSSVRVSTDNRRASFDESAFLAAVRTRAITAGGPERRDGEAVHVMSTSSTDERRKSISAEL